MANEHIREATKMMRLIDAHALIDEIDGIYKRHYVNSSYQFIHDFFRAVFRRIHKAPTVDAVEVVHGRWIHVPSSDMMTGKAYKCSECNKMRYGSFMPNYCPNCGAKMDGDGNGMQ